MLKYLKLIYVLIFYEKGSKSPERKWFISGWSATEFQISWIKKKNHVNLQCQSDFYFLRPITYLVCANDLQLGNDWVEIFLLEWNKHLKMKSSRKSHWILSMRFMTEKLVAWMFWEERLFLLFVNHFWLQPVPIDRLLQRHQDKVGSLYICFCPWLYSWFQACSPWSGGSGGSFWCNFPIAKVGTSLGERASTAGATKMGHVRLKKECYQVHTMLQSCQSGIVPA